MRTGTPDVTACKIEYTRAETTIIPEINVITILKNLKVAEVLFLASFFVMHSLAIHLKSGCPVRHVLVVYSAGS